MSRGAISAPYRLVYILPSVLGIEAVNVYHLHSIPFRKFCDAFANLLYDASSIVSCDERVGENEGPKFSLVGVNWVEGYCTDLRVKERINVKK